MEKIKNLTRSYLRRNENDLINSNRNHISDESYLISWSIFERAIKNKHFVSKFS